MRFFLGLKKKEFKYAVFAMVDSAMGSLCRKENYKQQDKDSSEISVMGSEEDQPGTSISAIPKLKKNKQTGSYR